MSTRCCQFLVVTAAALFWCPAAAAEPDVMFERDIRPILKTHCFQCHGEEGKLKGKLDVRWRRTLAVGGKSGPAITPGQPDHSLLVRRITEPEKPPPDVE